MKYLVTGANRGIGLEFVRALTARGDHVIATARRPSEATELKKIAEEGGEQVQIVQLDIADPETFTSLRELLTDRSLDVLINNAGTYPRGGQPGSFDFEALRKGFEVNTLGALRVFDAVYESMKKGERKLVVNITSQMGSIDDNGSGGSYSYRASKAALNMVTRSMAVDLEPEGFICFVAHPGWVQTDMGGSRALIDSETSVEKLLAIMDNASPDDAGKFWNWKGNELPW